MMKDQLQAMVALTMVAAVSGCAGGGGGSGWSGPTVSVLPADAPLRPGYEPSPCGRLYGYPVPCVPSQRAAIDAAMSDSPQSSNPISPWSTPLPVSSTKSTEIPVTSFDTTAAELSYITAGDAVSGTLPRSTYSRYWSGQLSEGGQPLTGASFSIGPRADLVNLAATGQPNILVDLQSGWGSDTGSAFTTSSAAKIVVVADQAAQKWDYQSFGVWNDARLTGHQSIYSLSFGSATPAAGLPTAGSALFTGKLAGFYVAPGGQGSIATADLAVNANFSERSLSFSSSNSRITRDLATATAAPNLNLGGTLTYAPGTNGFSGTLTNAGGTMSGSSKGQFYGPTANELGGVFTVNSPKTVETFTGAYGGKR
ncbi:MAG: transferrin-binding protein-like solute binding protein [Betaproteobacteria bacterium]|nr:MAG: transferrin-binding protein-like solute binding protein [Betaproteobacteria bacterium]TMI11599.1 MAG: transferrin-binding protein-like solute binding protein [Betaproteobacteria bacterium]